MDCEEHDLMDLSHQAMHVFRPERPGRQARRDSLRTPVDAAETARRVAIYAEQVAQTGQIDWLPHRDTLVDVR